MKNRLFLLIPAALIILTALSWFSVFRTQKRDSVLLDGYIAEAGRFEKNGVYYDALLNYKKAGALKENDYGILLKIADMTARLGYTDEFGTAYSKAAGCKKADSGIFEIAASFYIDHGEIRAAADVLKNASDKGISSEALDRFEKQVLSAVTEIYIPCDSIGGFVPFGSDSLAVYSDREKSGLVRSDGKFVVKAKYELVGMYDDKTGLIPVYDGNKWMYIDLKGNIRLAGEKTYDYAGVFGNGYAPVMYGGRYCYIDKKFNEHGGQWKYAGAFRDGIAAVCDNRWRFIGADFRTVCPDTFDFIKTDDYGFCSEYGIACVQKEGLYYIYDVSLNRTAGPGFSDIMFPASESGLIAVRETDRDTWSFADRKGNIVLRTDYYDAGSFSCGFAPCFDGEKWGYIDSGGNIAIEFEYSSATSFSDDGCAAVTVNNSVFIIALCARK